MNPLSRIARARPAFVSRLRESYGEPWTTAWQASRRDFLGRVKTDSAPGRLGRWREQGQELLIQVAQG
jgi:hypothetical protein